MITGTVKQVEFNNGYLGIVLLWQHYCGSSSTQEVTSALIDEWTTLVDFCVERMNLSIVEVST